MNETTMPAAEAGAQVDSLDERSTYELAFHVLPTVAEGEVSAVFDSIKAAITKTGADIFDEEAPERFDLAYEIVEHLEGKNRKFASAYFGWVRFKVESDAVEEVNEFMDHHNQILRHLLIRLTKVEEEHPFRFHEALQSQKQVSTVDESEVTPDTTTASEDENDSATEEESVPVDDAELDKALEEKEV